MSGVKEQRKQDEHKLDCFVLTAVSFIKENMGGG